VLTQPLLRSILNCSADVLCLEAESSDNTLSDTSVRQSYIQQKLENGLLKIWLDIQQKVKTYLLSTDLSSFKYDSFIQVLDIVNR